MKTIKATIVPLLLTILQLTATAAPLAEQIKSAAYFEDMRMQYAKRPDFEGGGWVAEPDREALLKAYNENSPKEFIAASEVWLKKCPVDAKVHLMRASLLLKIGDVQGHFYHRMVYYGLLTSIVTSGDGKSPKTAYKVITVDEEYTVLNHLGAKLLSQRLVDGPCDAMDAELGGEKTTIFFDVSIPMRAEQKALQPKK